MWTYADSLRFLSQCIDYEQLLMHPQQMTAAFDLSDFAHFLSRLGNPQTRFPCVHIAGTKGKGSTAAIMSSILRAAGYRTGLFTSPHINSYCERIQVNGLPIPEARFAEIIALLKSALPQRLAQQPSSFRTVFELLTALAFIYFAHQNVDIAVIETGLGGRLDSTNVVQPVASILTALGLDHTHILGSTLSAIAREKAGIIKPHTPVVLALQSEAARAECLPIIEEICREKHAALINSWERVEVARISHSLEGQHLVYRRYTGDKMAGSHGIHLTTPLLGIHQADNIQTALAALDVIAERGFPCSEDAVIAGVKQCTWPGRIELLGRNPYFIIDGAHCPISVSALFTTLDALFPSQPRTMLLGILRDKLVEQILHLLSLSHNMRRLIVFTAPSPRACPSETLAAQARAFCPEVLGTETPEKAVVLALSLASPEEVIAAFGSLYNIAPIQHRYHESKEINI
jgi:dihydrofolate synthase/folylpolyglutamate synthase